MAAGNKGIVSVSVIIPAYNVEEYVDHCMDSLIHQTLENIEVIVVDDGSTDGTLHMFEKYGTYVPNLRVIAQENSGSAGGPRNAGVRAALGKYIFFLDPDDVLPYNALELLYENSEKTNADISMGNYCKFNSKNKWTMKTISEQLFASQRIVAFEEEQYFLLNLLSWNKLYRKSFIDTNRIRYTEGIRYGEDREFMVMAYCLANQISIIPDIVYNYREREGQNKSATQLYTYQTFEENLITLEIANEIMNRHSNISFFSVLYRHRLQHDFLRFVDYFVQHHLDDEDLIRAIKELIKRYFALIGDWINLDLNYLQKVKLFYLSSGDLVNFRNALMHQNQITQRCELSIVNGVAAMKNQYVDEHFKEFPQQLFICNADLQLNKGIEKMIFEQGRFVIDGWAYFSRMDCSSPHTTIRTLVFRTECHDEIEYVLEPIEKKEITKRRGANKFNLDWSGFHGAVNLEELYISSEFLVGCSIYLKVSVGELFVEEKVAELPPVAKTLVTVDGNSAVYNIVGVLSSRAPKSYKLQNSSITVSSSDLAIIPERRLLQRIEDIKYEEAYIRLKGWACIPYLDLGSKNGHLKKVGAAN